MYSYVSYYVLSPALNVLGRLPGDCTREQGAGEEPEPGREGDQQVSQGRYPSRYSCFNN
jgi:hypothetical protein